MEIEFDVKVTSGVLYDYMLYHTYTSPAGLIGAVAGALLVAAYFMGYGILLLIAGAVILAKMTEEGVEVSQKGEVQSQKWEDMYRAVSTPKSIILYTSPVNASIFPKKDLGDKAMGVTQIISTHMAPKKVKIRS